MDADAINKDCTSPRSPADAEVIWEAQKLIEQAWDLNVHDVCLVNEDGSTTDIANLYSDREYSNKDVLYVTIKEDVIQEKRRALLSTEEEHARPSKKAKTDN